MLGSPVSSKVAKFFFLKNKGKKGNGKGGFKSTGKAYLGEEQTQDTEWWSEENSVWWSKGKMRRERFFGRWKTFLCENDSRTYQPQKGTGNEYYPYKGRGKEQKRKGKEGAIPQSRLSASETPSEEGYGHSCKSDDWYSSLSDDSSNSATRGTTAWYGVRQTAWMASVLLDLANHPTLVVLDLGCTRSIGSRAAIKKVPETRFVLWHYDRVLPLQ